MATPESIEKLLAGVAAGSLFEDKDFPPGSPQTLGPLPAASSSAAAAVRWIRFQQQRQPTGEQKPILFRPRFDQAPQPISLVPGAHSHSHWFFGAVGVLLHARSELLDSIFALSRPDRGAHALRLFRDGAWQLVLVDDAIPCTEAGAPLFASASVAAGGSASQHAWVSILEKAFAKRCGSYAAAAACSGLVAEGLADLTGAPVHTMAFASFGGSVDALWHGVRAKLARGCVCAAIRGSPTPIGDSLGIANNVPYTLVAADELSGAGMRLCILRCALGEMTWRGELSKGSPGWNTRVPARLREALAATPGTFVMELDDFARLFTEVVAADVGKPGTPLRSFTLRSAWSGASAGGCTNNFASWCRNPQFSLVSAQQKLTVAVALCQPDAITHRGSLLSIGFHVLRAQAANMRRTETQPLAKSEIVASTGAYVNRRDVVAEIELDPGSPVLIIPSVFEAGKESPFVLRVTAPGNVEFRELKAVSATAVAAAPPVAVASDAGKCDRCGKALVGEYFVVGALGQQQRKLCAACSSATEHKCGACDMPILAGVIFRTLGKKKFHVDCFRCSTCHASLGKDGVVIDEKLFCASCSRKCKACGKMIGLNAHVAVSGSGGDSFFHQACIQCHKCKKPLGGSASLLCDPSDSSGSTFLCEECAQQQH